MNGVAFYPAFGMILLRNVTQQKTIKAGMKMGEEKPLEDAIKALTLAVQESHNSSRHWHPEKLGTLLKNAEGVLAASTKTLELREATMAKVDTLSDSLMALAAKVEKQSAEVAVSEKKMEATNAVWLSELRKVVDTTDARLREMAAVAEQRQQNSDALWKQADAAQSKRMDDAWKSVDSQWKSVQLHSKMFMWVVGGALALGMFLHNSNQKALEAQNAQTSRHLERLGERVDSVGKNIQPPAAITPPATSPATTPVARPIYRSPPQQQTNVIIAPCCSNTAQPDSK